MEILNEKINVDNAKYLMSLTDEGLKTLIDPDNKSSCEEEGNKLYNNIDVYIKMLKKWLRTSIYEMDSKGFITTKYKPSKNMVSCGRRYAEGFGIQKLKKNIKVFLCSDSCYDIDMVNAHPSILLNIVKKHFPEIKHNRLEQYVTNRDEFLKSSGATKQQILISMNLNKPVKSSNQTFCKLDAEFKTIQKTIFDKFESKVELPDVMKSHKETLKQNKEGKYISSILNFYEDKILRKVQRNFKDKIHTICFDGFHLDINEKIKKTISQLNKMTDADGVKWAHKKFDKSVQIDEAIEIDFEDIPDYYNCKKIFEERHFLIENPIMFGRLYDLDGEKKYQFYQKDKFKDLVRPLRYFEPSVGKPVEFFSRWINMGWCSYT